VSGGRAESRWLDVPFPMVDVGRGSAGFAVYVDRYVHGHVRRYVYVYVYVLVCMCVCVYICMCRCVCRQVRA